MLAVTLLLSCLPLSPQQPLKIGVIAREASGSSDLAFVRSVKRAAEAINAAGGVDGAKVEIVFAAAATGSDVAPALAQLGQAGVAGLVASPERHLAAVARKANAGALPLVAFANTDADVARVIDKVIAHNFCMTRVGLVRDNDRDSREFGKLLAKGGGLTEPTTLLWELDVRSSAKKVQKEFEDARPEVLVFDTDAGSAAQFLNEHLASDPIPVILTPRAYGEALLKQPRMLFVVHGLSPAQAGVDSPYRRDYERDHGLPGFAAAEGYEAVQALARAFDAADGREPAAVTKALHGLEIDGVRGKFGFDAALDGFAPPLAVWIASDDRLLPYTPRQIPLPKPPADGDPVAKTAPPDGPQTGIGVPFGTWRTRDFPWEEGSQWVLLMWSGADDSGFATGDSDLQQLGLSTGGAAPLVDHLVKEEILARVVAITSGKYGRNEDGTAIPGTSLRICFGVHLDEKERKKKKQRLWPARFGGDHADAGGQAFGTFCRVYTSFIRRTIFQDHALEPPVSASDREFLDGTYVWGTEFDKDRRSEKVRALINSYAGSMALTLAHEVGHLTGLGHVTDPPTAIMNVEEGAGIDYPEAKFCENSWKHMVDKLGVVEQTSAKKKR